MDMTANTEVNPAPMNDGANESAGMLSEGREFDESAACFHLGEYKDDDLLTKVGMMQAFKCSSRTLQRMVERFEIPPAVPCAGRNIWSVRSLKAWIGNQIATREAEALKQAKKLYRV